MSIDDKQVALDELRRAVIRCQDAGLRIGVRQLERLPAVEIVIPRVVLVNNRFRMVTLAGVEDGLD